MSVTLSEAQLAAIKNQVDTAQASLIAVLGIISNSTLNPTAPAPQTSTGGTTSEAWKQEAATDRQLAFLEKAKITPKPGLTKGEASTLIDGLIKKLKEGKR